MFSNLVKNLIKEVLDTEASLEVFYVNKEGSQACTFNEKGEQKQIDLDQKCLLKQALKDSKLVKLIKV